MFPERQILLISDTLFCKSSMITSFYSLLFSNLSNLFDITEDLYNASMLTLNRWSWLICLAYLHLKYVSCCLLKKVNTILLPISLCSAGNIQNFLLYFYKILNLWFKQVLHSLLTWKKLWMLLLIFSVHSRFSNFTFSFFNLRYIFDF